MIRWCLVVTVSTAGQTQSKINRTRYCVLRVVLIRARVATPSQQQQQQSGALATSGNQEHQASIESGHRDRWQAANQLGIEVRLTSNIALWQLRQPLMNRSSSSNNVKPMRFKLHDWKE